MTQPCIPWQAWAPPLDPPTPTGLPEDQAQCIADAYWSDSPHLAAALMWEAYAATLPPSPAVSQVQTGAQSVAYSPAAPVGEYGLAMSRAAWHRSFVTGTVVSVPLETAIPGQLPLPLDWWQRNLEHAP